MSEQGTHSDNCTLDVAKLFERVNAGRKVRSLPPIEYSAMASRCNLRFNLNKKRNVDFNNETVIISPEDIEALEGLLNEQFDCMLEGAVSKSCVKPKKARPAATVHEPVMPELTPPPQTDTETDSGLMSKIKKIFG